LFFVIVWVKKESRDGCHFCMIYGMDWRLWKGWVRVSWYWTLSVSFCERFGSKPCLRNHVWRSMKMPDAKTFVWDLFCDSPEVVSYEAFSPRNQERFPVWILGKILFFGFVKNLGFRVLVIALRQIILNAEKRVNQSELPI